MTQMLEIPDKYAALGASRGFDPTPLQKMRLWLLAYPGGGKTTFCASNPRMLILDSEDRARDVIAGCATRIHYNKVEKYLALVDDLCADAADGIRPFDHIAIDTVDAFIEQALPYLATIYDCPHDDIREYGGGKSGWFKIRSFLLGILSRLAVAGYGWTVCGHVKDIVTDLPGGEVRTSRRPSIQPSVMDGLNSSCHIMAMMHRERYVPTRKVIAKSPKTGKIIHEKEVPDPDKAEDRFWMTMAPAKGNDADRLDNAKNPYLGYLDEQILIPRGGGWAALEEAYARAITRAQEDNVT